MTMTGASFLTMAVSASVRYGPVPVWMRVRTTSTRRFCARPSGGRVAWRSAPRRRSPATDIRRSSTPLAMKSSHDRRGARARELPVRRVARARDRLRVRVALDDDRVRSLVARGSWRSCRRSARACGLSDGLAGVEEHLVGEQLDDQAAAADGDVDLALRPAFLARSSIRRLSCLKPVLLLAAGAAWPPRSARPSTAALVDRVSGRSDGQRRLGGRCRRAAMSEPPECHHGLAAATGPRRRTRPGATSGAPRTWTCSPTRSRTAP